MKAENTSRNTRTTANTLQYTFHHHHYPFRPITHKTTHTTPQKMNYHLKLLALLCLSIPAKAQPPLCLSADSTNNIDFRSEELNNYLHLEKNKAIFFGKH